MLALHDDDALYAGSARFELMMNDNESSVVGDKAEKYGVKIRHSKLRDASLGKLPTRIPSTMGILIFMSNGYGFCQKRDYYIPRKIQVKVCKSDIHRDCEKFSNIFPFLSI